MKLMTVFAVASLAIAGVACSESKSKPAAEAADAMTVESADAGGTLNLSMPSSLSDSESTGGTLNLNLGGSNEDVRLIGSGQLATADFGDVPESDFGIDLDDAPVDPDDEIIRVEPK
ncbi:MAG: hypothetical protein R3C13_03840 [Hyphomonas sp.]|uniref:hypothetical protein n=1 Tax=Hyphomonas sp. TaxID=87 RepID=UPI003527B3E8